MIPNQTYAWGKCGNSLQSMRCLIRSADTDFDSRVQFLGSNFSTGCENRCLVFILWMASAGSRLLGQFAVQFTIVLHLYSLLVSSANACTLSSPKSSRLPTPKNILYYPCMTNIRRNYRQQLK